MRKMPALIALLATLVTGCASGPPRLEANETLDRYMRYAGEPIDSFNVFRFDGWTPLARDKLAIWTGLNEAYLLTLRPTCPDLLFATGIQVDSRGSIISRFDSVRVGRDRCQITEIRPVDVRQMKAARRAQRSE